MVKALYSTLVTTEYEYVKQNACGRQACTVLIIVADEIDAMSTARMLTQFLREDNISYAIRYASNMVQVCQFFDSSKTVDIKSVFLINCGATANIPRLFQLEHGGELRCFIIDNHRPVHLANVYSRHSVVVFENDVDQEDVPEDGPVLSVSDASSSSSSDLDDDDDDDDDGDDDGDDDDDDDEDEDENDDEDDISDNEDIESVADEEFEGDLSGDEENSTDHAAQNDDEALAVDNDVTVYDGRGSPATIMEHDGGEKLVGDNADEVGTLIAAEREDAIIKDFKKRGPDSDGLDSEVSDSRFETLPKRQRPNDEESDEIDEDVAIEKSTDILDEVDDEVPVVGRNRKALAERHDPRKKRKRQLQSYYSQVTYFVAPSAYMLMIAMDGRTGAQVPLDLIWNAILGITDQYIKGNIPEYFYFECCEQLKLRLSNHLDMTTPESLLSRGLSKPGEVDITIPTAEAGHIAEEKEFRFFLYRHWSLYDAIYYSPYIAAKLAVWKSSGENKLQELLAKMGIPLQQCKQSFSFISPVLRAQFRRELDNEKIRKDYNLVNPDIYYQSFCRYNSFKSPVAASDVVHAASALLELRDFAPFASSGEFNSGSATSSFAEAYDCLGLRSDELLKKGVQAAIAQQKTMMRKVSTMLEGYDSISRLTRLHYVFLTRTGSGSAASKQTSVTDIEHESPFSRPHALMRLGRTIMELKRCQSRKEDGWVGRKLLPLILFSENSSSTYLVVGVSPITYSTVDVSSIEDRELSTLKILSNFKHFFALAAKDSRDGFSSEGFDGNIIQISKRDALDFLGALDFALSQVSDVKT